MGLEDVSEGSLSQALNVQLYKAIPFRNILLSIFEEIVHNFLADDTSDSLQIMLIEEIRVGRPSLQQLFSIVEEKAEVDVVDKGDLVGVLDLFDKELSDQGVIQEEAGRLWSSVRVKHDDRFILILIQELLEVSHVIILAWSLDEEFE